MSDPYVGEIRIFAGNFAPAGWMFCDGQLLPISEYDTLFNLIGTTYGGDGQNTFALPDLRGRIPLHMGTDSVNNTTYLLAQKAGVENVTLTLNQIPVHSHPAVGQGDAATQPGPGNGFWANSGDVIAYSTNANPPVQMAAAALPSQGGSQPHDNMMPYLGLNFILSLFGIYPSPT